MCELLCISDIYPYIYINTTAGTAALNSLHSEMSAEDVELLLEESEEARNVSDI